jgi:hypothetical protein
MRPRAKAGQIAWYKKVTLVAAICAGSIVWIFRDKEPRVAAQSKSATAPATVPAAPKAGCLFQSWAFQGLTGRCNAGKAPDDTTSAFELVASAGAGPYVVKTSLKLNNLKPLAASVYVQRQTISRASLQLGAGTDELQCNIDLQTGITAAATVGAAQVWQCKATAQKGSWWRLELSGLVSPSGSPTPLSVGISLPDAGNAGGATGGGSVLIWNASAGQVPPR